MGNLSKKEWIAVGIAVIFVAYTLFGSDVRRLFQKNTTMNENQAAAETATKQLNNGGVVINDIVVGKGVEVKKGQLITAHYILSLANGQVIQNSKDLGQPFKFTLGAGQVIPGWELGFAGMKIGGVRTIVIPPELAYGDKQAGPIPPNSTLIFTIELIDAADVPSQ